MADKKTDSTSVDTLKADTFEAKDVTATGVEEQGTATPAAGAQENTPSPQASGRDNAAGTNSAKQDDSLTSTGAVKYPGVGKDAPGADMKTAANQKQTAQTELPEVPSDKGNDPSQGQTLQQVGAQPDGNHVPGPKPPAPGQHAAWNDPTAGPIVSPIDGAPLAGDAFVDAPYHERNSSVDGTP